MMMCGFDPIIDFGTDTRLTLAAAGQMASPLQAAWVFSALEERLVSLRGISFSFSADAQIQAFMTWLLMRGRQVWPALVEPIEDSNTMALTRFWSVVSQLSMPELVQPLRWPELSQGTISVASVLDLLIRKSQAIQDVPRPVFEAPEDVPMTAIDDEGQECDSTPWYDPPILPLVPTLNSQDGCLVVFLHECADPIELKVSHGETVQQLLHAHTQLVGNFGVTKVCDHVGNELPFTHELQVGQVVYIACIEGPPAQCGVESKDGLPPGPSDVSVSRVDVASDVQKASVAVHPASVPHVVLSSDQGTEVCRSVHCLSQVPDGDHAVPSVCSASGGKQDQVVSPTAPWTFPPREIAQTPSSKFGPFDAGQCDVPDGLLPDCESWISAAPLLGLSGPQFLKLHVPMVQSTKHLWSLRHQFLKSADRSAILDAQGEVWSDDEFRHHIGLLLALRTAKRFEGVNGQDQNCVMLDPLLLTGWVHHGTVLCRDWALSHPEILAEGTILLSACVLDGQWIPVVLTPNGMCLNFSTWDSPGNAHDKLNEVVECLGKLLGFSQVNVLRHQRMFFTSTRCGALAMSFLHHEVFNSMLPTTNEEAEMVHTRLRAVYKQEVDRCQIARRPWIWGTGDEPETFANEPGRSSSDVPNAPVPSTSFSHQCMDKEARLELLRQKGKMWGDDEIRYHLQHMINHPRNVSKTQFAAIPGFVMLDPLLLTAWDSIGELMCAAWCRRNTCVSELGFHVVTVFLHNEHWFPVWIVPHGCTIVAHVVKDDVIDHAIVMPVLEVLRQQFGFCEKVLNSHPSRLPPHSLCGAAAIAFLGHIMVSADLPDDLATLGDCHSNMKAAFVHALFESKCCICPAAWGSGFQSGLVKQLAEELVKHGVA